MPLIDIDAGWPLGLNIARTIKADQVRRRRHIEDQVGAGAAAIAPAEMTPRKWPTA